MKKSTGKKVAKKAIAKKAAAKTSMGKKNVARKSPKAATTVTVRDKPGRFTQPGGMSFVRSAAAEESGSFKNLFQQLEASVQPVLEEGKKLILAAGGVQPAGAPVPPRPPLAIDQPPALSGLNVVIPALADAASEVVSGKISKMLDVARRSLASSIFGLCDAQGTPRSGYDLAKLTPRTVVHTANMDPRLQLAAARARQGQPRAATASSSTGELPVVARVSNVNEWEAISEVRIGCTVGKTDDGSHIVTARIPASRIDAVRAKPCVLAMKASQVVRPMLAETTRETGCRPDLLPSNTKSAGGRGVVIGIVDFGCDFAHQNFRRMDGTTRVESIWHQASPVGSNTPFGYGKVYREAEINQALGAGSPYAALGYGPTVDTPSQKGEHGTHVMDIAAGNGLGSGVPGCAPEATLIFVDLSASDVPWDGADVVGTSFGDSVRLLEALKFIFQEAGDRPCVINLSLGTNGGPHDGTTPVEKGIDALVNEKANRAVVIAASNSHEQQIHTAGKIPGGGSVDIPWSIGFDHVPAEIDMWIGNRQRVAVELIGPDGTSIGLVEPGVPVQFMDGNQIILLIANRINDSSNGDSSIGIFISDSFKAGTWTVRLHARPDGNGTSGDVEYHAWVERYDSAQSNFGTASVSSCTLGSISCGRESIVVGSYDAKKSALPISWFSSEGPTRDGREKPEISAPGHGVLAAWSRTGNKVVDKSGTSMAAPAVSGIIALIFAEAIASGKELTSTQLRTILAKTARKNPPGGSKWDAQYGNGRISAQALKKV